MPETPATLYAAHLATVMAHADAALAAGGFDTLLVPSGTRHYQVFDDRDYPFATNPQFKYWLPVTQAPGSWLVYCPGKRPKLIYLQPRDYWHVVPQTPAGDWVEHFDITIVRTPEDARAHLPAAGRMAILGEPQSALGDVFVPNNPPEVINHLEFHRAYKTPYELAVMRRATRRGARAHRAAERAFRAGASEFGIHLAYCQAAGQDATELPYQNIVALNAHGAVLHYTELDRVPPKPMRSLLIDAGASEAGYACDITRTYSARDDDFAALIGVVDRVQQALCEQVRNGTDYRAIHLAAHTALAGVLHDAGLIRMGAEEAVATGVSSAFFPHGIGHGIGLQVHEVAGFAESAHGGTLPKPDGHPYLRLTRPLAPGMVVTIEPGVYFIDMLLDGLREKGLEHSVEWNAVEHYKPYGGIRIEDDVVCTEDAPENLTRLAFAEATP